MKISADIFKPVLFVACISTILSCSNEKPLNSTSGPSTVNLPLTKVENQAGAGFCWSYTLSAHIAALAKQQGIEVNLSEEYLGLHHILQDLQETLKATDPVAALAKVSDGYMYEGALNLLTQAGVVPESFFNIKFENSPADLAKKAFAAEFGDSAKLAGYRANPDKLREKLGTLIGIAIPGSKAVFTYEGKTFTPKSFMSAKLKFDPLAFEIRKIEYAKLGEFNLETAIIKSALLSKIPVPVAVGVFAGVNNQWNSEACEKGYCDILGGHAMLAVDFVTEKGRGGEMSDAEIKQVYRNKLQYLIIKNSWGEKRGLTQQGEVSQDETLLGFDVLTRDFFRYSALKFMVQYVVPKSLFAEKKYLVGYDFATDINMEKTYSEGEEISLKANVIDSITKSDTGVTFSWTILNSAGKTVFSGLGLEIKVPPLSQGQYKVTLNSELGSEHDVQSSTLSILKTYDVFKDKLPVKISNNISWQTTSAETVISLNYKGESTLQKSTPMIIELPEFTLQHGEALGFSFVQKKSDPLVNNPLIQIALDNSTKFISLPCEQNGKDEIKTTTCLLPVFELADTEHKVKARLYSDLSASASGYIENNLLIYDLKVKSSRPFDIPKSSARVEVKFPSGVSEFQQQMLGSEIKLLGLFSKDTDLVRTYVDAALESESLASDFKTMEGDMLVSSKAFKFDTTGYHEIKFVAVKEKQEMSFITYKLLVAAKLVTEADKETIIIGGNKINAALGPEVVPFTLKTGEVRLAFSEMSGENIPFAIDNNMTARIVTWLDLRVLEMPTLLFAAGMKLEKDFDYLRIYASENGGTSFTLVQEFTGDKNILVTEPLQISLAPYAKKDNILLMVEMETDQAGNSEAGFIKQISIK